MYLHLGADTVVPLQEIVAILDLKITSSTHTNNFLNKMKLAKQIIDISENNAKKFSLLPIKSFIFQPFPRLL